MQREQKQALFSGAQYQDKRQWTQVKHEMFPLTTRNYLCCAGDGTLAQAAQRLSSLEMFRRRTVMALGTPLWASLLDQRLGQLDPEGLPTPPTPQLLTNREQRFKHQNLTASQKFTTIHLIEIICISFSLRHSEMKVRPLMNIFPIIKGIFSY